MQGVPFNEEFENSLLVGILQDPTLLPQVSEIIRPTDFSKFANKEIFQVLLDTPIEEIDSLTIQDKLSKNGHEHFEKLVRDGDAILPSLSNILIYAEEIKSKSLLRDCIRVGQDIAALGYREGITADEAYSQMETLFAHLVQQRAYDNHGESTKQAFQNFLDTLGTKVKKDGIKTGFFSLDMMLHGLEGLVVLAARPSMGKTAFAINIIRNVAVHKPVLFFSLEQSQEQVFERMLAAEAKVNLEEIRSGAFIADVNAMNRVKDVSSYLVNLMDKIHVDQRAALSAGHIASTSRQKKMEWDEIGLIVVDYLHIMTLNSGAKVDVLGDAVRDLRALGKELNTPILLLSQLSRQPENETDENKKRIRRKPDLPDLRGSGEIEQVADVVMFLHRESYGAEIKPDEDIMEVLVRKHRNGRTGSVNLDWLPPYQKFTDQL